MVDHDGRSPDGHRNLANYTHSSRRKCSMDPKVTQEETGFRV